MAHTLSNKNMDTLTGDCVVCGPKVPLNKYGRCKAGVLQHQRERYSATKQLKSDEDDWRKGPHYMSKRDFDNLTGNCPTHGPRSAMTKSGQCRIWFMERRGRRYSSRDGNHSYLTRGEIARMKKGKVCELCGTDQKLCIDHCHETGKIRGILCNRCNTLLGMARENTEVLMNAIGYLNQHETR